MVTPDWVSASLASRRLADPREYEVVMDAAGADSGPTLGRERRDAHERQLLHGFDVRHDASELSHCMHSIPLHGNPLPMLLFLLGLH